MDVVSQQSIADTTLDNGDLAPLPDEDGGGKPDFQAAAREAVANNPDLENQVDDQYAQALTPEEEAAKAAADKAAADAAATQSQAAGTPEEYQELEDAIAEAGINLGFTMADIPPELRPQAERILASVAETAQTLLQDRVTVQEAKSAIDQFGKQLTEDPSKVMLALAMNAPEAYKQVRSLMDEAESDPRVKEMINRDLASEARLREAERREQGILIRERQVKANAVIAASARAAKAHGIDKDLAEQWVAMAVRSNGGDLEVKEVDSIVKEVADRFKRGAGKTPGSAAATQRVATPAKQQAVAKAPTNAVAGSGSSNPAPPARPQSQGNGLKDGGSQREGGGGGVFRNLVKGANLRVRGF